MQVYHHMKVIIPASKYFASCHDFLFLFRFLFLNKYHYKQSIILFKTQLTLKVSKVQKWNTADFVISRQCVSHMHVPANENSIDIWKRNEIQYNLGSLKKSWLILIEGREWWYKGSLRPVRSEVRIPVRARFSTLVQTCPGA